MGRILDRLDALYAIIDPNRRGSPQEDAAYRMAAGWLEQAKAFIDAEADEDRELVRAARRRRALGRLAPSIRC